MAPSRKHQIQYKYIEKEKTTPIEETLLVLQKSYCSFFSMLLCHFAHRPSQNQMLMSALC